MILEVETNHGITIEVYTEGDYPRVSTCKKCGKVIYWGKTENGKSMPLSKRPDGKYICHFADCPNANYFRK